MTPVAGTDYLETEVMTATPQRLQLMLIDSRHPVCQPGPAPLRTAKQPGGPHSHPAGAANHGRTAHRVEVPSPNDGLVRRVAAVYLFIYRSLVAANLEHSTPGWTTLCACSNSNAKPGAGRANNSAPKARKRPPATHLSPGHVVRGLSRPVSACVACRYRRRRRSRHVPIGCWQRLR